MTDLTDKFEQKWLARLFEGKQVSRIEAQPRTDAGHYPVRFWFTNGSFVELSAESPIQVSNIHRMGMIR